MENMENSELTTIGEEYVKTKKRGSKSASIAETTTAKPAEIGQAIRESFQYFNRPIIKSNEECAQRLNEYFKQCSDTGQIPTVEDMALALGTIRETLWKWEHCMGCDAERSHMIKKAKEILAGIDAKLVSTGKIPQITYIFRAKNYFGLTDKQEVVVTPSAPLGDTKDTKALEAEYVDSVVTDPKD